MKKLILSLLILISTPALSDLIKGLVAYHVGDYATAFGEFKLSAEKGDAEARFNLGVMYDNGHGVPQNFEAAAKWYTKSAEQGYAPAQHELGVIYNDGHNVSQDYEAAAKWYTKAAEQGYAPAQHKLGDIYYRGQGVIQDYTLAHMWYDIAASQAYIKAGEAIEEIAKKMTPEQIASAQELARECVAKDYKDC